MNIDTDLQFAFTEGVRDYMIEKKEFAMNLSWYICKRFKNQDSHRQSHMDAGQNVLKILKPEVQEIQLVISFKQFCILHSNFA